MVLTVEPLGQALRQVREVLRLPSTRQCRMWPQLPPLGKNLYFGVIFLKKYVRRAYMVGYLKDKISFEILKKY